MRERVSVALVAGWVFADLLLVLFIIGQGDTMTAEPPPPTTTIASTSTASEPAPGPTTTAPQYAKPVSIVITDVSTSWFVDPTDEDRMHQQEIATRIAQEMERNGLIGKRNGRIQIFGQRDTKLLSEKVADLMRQSFPEETAGAEILPFLGDKGPTTVTIEFFVVAS